MSGDWQGRIRYLALDHLARRLARMGGDALTVAFTPGHLGDLLHAVPMMRALRKGKPEKKLVWLVGPWSETLARRYGHLADEIVAFGPNLATYARGRKEWRQSAWTQWRIAAGLNGRGVEALIAPMDSTGRFLANALVPRIWSGIGDWRLPRTRAEIETHVQAREKDRYEADAWCGLLGVLGIEAKADRLEYSPTDEERAQATRFMEAEGMDGDRPLALVAPGSGWKGKNWMPERFGEVAAWLEREKGFRIAWIGGAGEESLVPAGRESDLNWVGRLPLPIVVAAMGKARLFVGNDGGLLHFAAATGLPTVSIWGPTRPEKWGPRGANHRQVRKAETCEGCVYWDYRAVCMHGGRCMRAVEVPDVAEAVEEVLAAQPPIPSKSAVDR